MKLVCNWLVIFGLAVLLGGCEDPADNPDDNPPPQPTAVFTCSGPFGVQDSTRFVNTSTDADSYNWDFGDGSGSTDDAPVHVFQQAGQYIVRLVATGAGGTATAIDTVRIFIKPTVSFAVLGPYNIGDSMRFENYTTRADRYLWDFGDGSTTTRFSPKHRYPQPGQYTVKLRATGNGGTAERSTTVNVFNTPAGRICDCRVSQYIVPSGPGTTLPNETVAIGAYGVDGIEFKGVNYGIANNGTTQAYLLSVPYVASNGGSGFFYHATKTLRIQYHNGGINSGPTITYDCTVR